MLRTFSRGPLTLSGPDLDRLAEEGRTSLDTSLSQNGITKQRKVQRTEVSAGAAAPRNYRTGPHIK